VSVPDRLARSRPSADATRDRPVDGREQAAPDSALEGTQLAERIAAIASDRKAEDIRLIDLRSLVAYTDTLVVCSGNTERQTKAIHDAVHQQLKDDGGLLPRRVEGEREGRWILMDYLDCIVHVFTPEARAYYRLEQLWGEAPARSVG
jgi:ribosome-associated protein